MPNLSILDLLAFCNANIGIASCDENDMVDINSCGTWLTVRTVRSGLNASTVTSDVDIHANYTHVWAKWVDAETLESRKDGWIIDPVWEDLNKRLVRQREESVEGLEFDDRNLFTFTFQTTIQ